MNLEAFTNINDVEKLKELKIFPTKNTIIKLKSKFSMNRSKASRIDFLAEKQKKYIGMTIRSLFLRFLNLNAPY